MEIKGDLQCSKESIDKYNELAERYLFLFDEYLSLVSSTVQQNKDLNEVARKFEKLSPKLK